MFAADGGQTLLMTVVGGVPALSAHALYARRLQGLRWFPPTHTTHAAHNTYLPRPVAPLTLATFCNNAPFRRVEGLCDDIGQTRRAELMTHASTTCSRRRAAAGGAYRCPFPSPSLTAISRSFHSLPSLHSYSRLLQSYVSSVSNISPPLFSMSSLPVYVISPLPPLP